MPIKGASKAVAACAVLFLSACSSIVLDNPRVQTPGNLSEARALVANSERYRLDLEYELNEKTRACYDRFFVSSCVDNVRATAAQYRRAHLEAVAKAEDMIRLDEFSRKRSQSQ